MFATTKRFWSTMQLITNKYVLYMRLFIFAFGAGVWCNLVYPPGLKRMNFSLTVISLHVCYNQEILVNIAADHRQRCVIYKRLLIFAWERGGGGGIWCNLVYPPETLVLPIPLYPYHIFQWPTLEGLFFQMNLPPPCPRETNLFFNPLSCRASPLVSKIVWR